MYLSSAASHSVEHNSNTLCEEVEESSASKLPFGLFRMLDLVEQIKGFILDGQVVYMHCWGGRGRAGTIASCFLASCYHLSADETADRIQLAFDTRNDGGRNYKSQNMTVHFTVCERQSCDF